MARPKPNAKRILERLRTNEPAGSLAEELGAREAEVLAAREIVRRIGEHQASAAGRLSDPLAQAVVEAAVQVEHSGFLKLVAEGGSKGAASAARRGLAILRSKGIDVDVAPQGEAVYRAEAPQAEENCFASTHDTLGDRLLWIPRPHRGGGLQLITLLLSDTQGVARVDSDEASRKSFRRLRDELSRRGSPHGVALLEISPARARGLVAEARARNDKGLDIASEALLSGLAGDPRDARSPLESEPPLQPEVEGRRLAESGALHDEPEISTWVPDEASVRALKLRLDEVQTSRLYVDEAQRREQAEREVEKAVADYFDERRAALYAGRLFELAEACRQLGRAEASERAAATARALRGRQDPTSVAFCRRLFEKTQRGSGHRHEAAAGAAGPDERLVTPVA